MKRRIEKGLMFGNLVEVSSPQLIERYDRALRHLGRIAPLEVLAVFEHPPRYAAFSNLRTAVQKFATEVVG